MTVNAFSSDSKWALAIPISDFLIPSSYFHLISTLKNSLISTHRGIYNQYVIHNKLGFAFAPVNIVTVGHFY